MITSSLIALRSTILRHGDGTEWALDILDPESSNWLFLAATGDILDPEEWGQGWDALEFIAFAASLQALHPLAAIALYHILLTEFTTTALR